MWWIPRSGTNPRGFGIKVKAIEELIKKAGERGNFVTIRYRPINVEGIREKYWRSWYNILKKLALES